MEVKSTARRRVLFASTALIASPILSTWPSKAAAASRGDIDLRNSNEGDPAFVLFCARDWSLNPLSPTGHAFVSWGKEDSGSKMSWVRSFGLHPKQDANGAKSIVIGEVPGEIRDDAQSHYDFLLNCQVSRGQFDTSVQVLDAWSKRGNYQLIYEDCASFMLDVAKSISLALPSRDGVQAVRFPITLVQRLAELNTQNDFVNGMWRSQDAQKRFEFAPISSSDGWLEERSQTGATLKKKVTLEKTGRGKWKILRDNDSEVLRFLGARESVVQAILNAGPKPSYFEISRPSSKEITSTWYGIRWKLDANNKLVEVVQPGSGNSSTFSFARTF